MTNNSTKTYRVSVIERTLAFYEVEAEDARAAAESWQDGEFESRDDEALDTEGPCSVREQQPDGKWRKVPPPEWQVETSGPLTVSGEHTQAHTPEPWYVDGLADNETQLWIRSFDRPIANIRIGKEPDSDKANACLIAAAPNLLAACRMVVSRWERGDLAEAARACGAAIAATILADPPAVEYHARIRLVVYSPKEDAYWSNKAGWGDFDAADIFTSSEQRDLRLPRGGRWATLRPYSVLLHYPDYLDDTGHETYYAFVLAPDPIEAVAMVQRKAAAAQAVDIDDPTDFTLLLVTEGHHNRRLFSKN
jgi:hypothetical protein